MADQEDVLIPEEPIPTSSDASPKLMQAVFRVDGARVTVSPHAAGPWDATMQHGSAPASLVVWAAEAMATQAPMRIARV
jgi:hypothetical protein